MVENESMKKGIKSSTIYDLRDIMKKIMDAQKCPNFWKKSGD